MTIETTVEVIYLGSMSDLDPDESNYVTEHAGNLVGMTFGSGNAPLHSSLGMVTFEDSYEDGIISSNDDDDDDDDGDDLSGENISFDGTSSELDSITSYNVTITFSDGSTANTEMAVMQDVDGRVFMTPNVNGSPESAVMDDHPIVSIQLNSVVGDNHTGIVTYLTPDAFITCFTTGTMIATAKGPVDVANLVVGDLVQTMDHGLQPIRWVGGRQVWAIDNLVPIRIRAGALGSGVPDTDLLVSPQHRMLLRSKVAHRMFNTNEVLVAAKKLTGLPGIQPAGAGHFVTYWHILFDRHEIIFAAGAASESLFLGPEAQKTLGDAAVAEIRQLFPQLIKQFERPIPARQIIKGKKEKQLMRRHIKNIQAVFQEI